MKINKFKFKKKKMKDDSVWKEHNGHFWIPFCSIA